MIRNERGKFYGDCGAGCCDQNELAPLSERSCWVLDFWRRTRVRSDRLYVYQEQRTYNAIDEKSFTMTLLV